MKPSNDTFGPFFDLPLNTTKAHNITLETDGKVTLVTEMVEGRYWIILYTNSEVKEEFLRIMAIDQQKIEYTSRNGENIIVTHWEEVDGQIAQCNLNIESK
jgi:hypothetical protein